MTTITVEWLTDLLARHDPEALICFGCPDHEYRPEAKRALPRLQSAASEAECLDVLTRTFAAMFSGTYRPNVPYMARAEVMSRLALAAAEVWQRLNLPAQGGRSCPTTSATVPSPAARG